MNLLLFQCLDNMTDETLPPAQAYIFIESPEQNNRIAMVWTQIFLICFSSVHTRDVGFTHLAVMSSILFFFFFFISPKLWRHISSAMEKQP